MTPVTTEKERPKTVRILDLNRDVDREPCGANSPGRSIPLPNPLPYQSRPGRRPLRSVSPWRPSSVVAPPEVGPLANLGGHAIERVRDPVLGTGEEVAVAVQDRDHARVSGSLRDLGRTRTGRDPKSHRSVPEVVDTEPLEASGVRPGSPDSLAELASPDGHALGRREYKRPRIRVRLRGRGERCRDNFR